MNPYWNGYKYVYPTYYYPTAYYIAPTSGVEIPVKADAWAKLSKETQKAILKELEITK